MLSQSDMMTNRNQNIVHKPIATIDWYAFIHFNFILIRIFAYIT